MAYPITSPVYDLIHSGLDVTGVKGGDTGADSYISGGEGGIDAIDPAFRSHIQK